MRSMPHQLDRWMYQGGHPNRMATVLNRLWRRAASAGLAPRRLSTLEVRGRRTGRLTSFPIVVADHQDERYLGRCSASASTRSTTPARPAGRPCSAMEVARPSTSKRSRSAPALPKTAGLLAARPREHAPHPGGSPLSSVRWPTRARGGRMAAASRRPCVPFLAFIGATKVCGAHLWVSADWAELLATLRSASSSRRSPRRVRGPRQTT
jgi:hypothetical protein